MKPRERRSFVDAAQAFEKLREEVTASFAAADRSRRRLEILAYLGALLSEFQAALDAYRDEKAADSSGPSPPWLLPDTPMAGLRKCRLQLLDIQRSAPGLEADHEIAVREQEALAAGSGAGCELVDACDDMAWFLDKYLYMEILAESTAAPALPVESRADLVDERAREQMPEATSDRTLARFRDFAAGGTADVAEVWRLTKGVARRRKRINAVLEESKEDYMAAARAVVPRLAESAPWAFENGAESERILSSIESVEAPPNRLRMKRWYVVQIVLETITGWASRIRASVTDEEVGSGDDP